MKGHGLFLRIALLLTLALAVFIAGCGGADPPTNDPAAPPETRQEQPKAETPASDPSDLKALLARSEGHGFTYEVVVTMQGITEGTVSKHWDQGDKSREERPHWSGTGTVVTIWDGDIHYDYFPEENRAVKSLRGDYDDDEWDEPLDDWDTQNMKLVGRDKVDGKPCLVYELIPDQDEEVAFEGTARVWFWEQYGFMMKMEIGDAMTYEIRNVKVGKIPDSVFKLPAGVEIEEY